MLISQHLAVWYLAFLRLGEPEGSPGCGPLVRRFVRERKYGSRVVHQQHARRGGLVHGFPRAVAGPCRAERRPAREVTPRQCSANGP